ncbi:hypothetical protein BH20ACT14_BH20ACT14_12080 [soil metagenome]
MNLFTALLLLHDLQQTPAVPVLVFAVVEVGGSDRLSRYFAVRFA